MAIYKSALGRQVDMGALAARNEKVRAVGNMNVNARGDTIDSYGRVIMPVNEKVNQKYVQTVGNKSANAVKKPETKQPVRQNIPPVADTVQKVQETKVELVEEIVEELTQEEKQFEEELSYELEVENIKKQELSKNVK